MTISTGRNNNLVAESDLQAGIAALRAKFDAKIAAAAANDDTVQCQLLADCSRSFTAKLQQIVQPISDEAYHVYLSRFNDDMVTCPAVAGEENDVLPAASSRKSSRKTSTVDEFEFDEEALVDQAAAVRVQELREAIRAQASTIQSLRAATLDRAVAVAERQVQLWSSSQTRAKAPPPSSSDASALLEQHRDAIEKMKASLSSMQAALQETGSVLPAKLRSFQLTLQEIERSLDKSGGSSKIEQAIYSREEQIIAMPGEENDADSMDFQVLAPEQRLANLLCRY